MEAREAFGLHRARHQVNHDYGGIENPDLLNTRLSKMQAILDQKKKSRNGFLYGLEPEIQRSWVTQGKPPSTGDRLPPHLTGPRTRRKHRDPTRLAAAPAADPGRANGRCNTPRPFPRGAAGKTGGARTVKPDKPATARGHRGELGRRVAPTPRRS